MGRSGLGREVVKVFAITINLLVLLLLAWLGWFCTHASSREDDDRSLRSGPPGKPEPPGPADYPTGARRRERPSPRWSRRA